MVQKQFLFMMKKNFSGLERKEVFGNIKQDKLTIYNYKQGKT